MGPITSLHTDTLRTRLRRGFSKRFPVMDSQAGSAKFSGKKDVPGVSEETTAGSSRAGSDLVSGKGIQVLVPGKRRLLREVCDSDSEEEEDQVASPSSYKKGPGSITQTKSSVPSVARASLGRFKKTLEEDESDESDDSGEEVQYLRTERVELSQSLMTSWLVPRRSRKAKRVKK